MSTCRPPCSSSSAWISRTHTHGAREAPARGVPPGPVTRVALVPTVVDVTSKDISEFLTSRRAKATPEQAGLPAYGVTRRVSGLRREEVALLAGISVEYYTRLERGRATGISESVLDGVA